MAASLMTSRTSQRPTDMSSPLSKFAISFLADVLIGLSPVLPEGQSMPQEVKSTEGAAVR